MTALVFGDASPDRIRAAQTPGGTGAVRVLAELDLLPQLREIAVETSELCYFNKFGQLIWREPRGTDAGLRVDVGATLRQSFREDVGGVAVRTHRQYAVRKRLQ